MLSLFTVLQGVTRKQYLQYIQNNIKMHFASTICSLNVKGIHCYFSAFTFEYVTFKFVALVQQKQLEEQRCWEYSITNPDPLFIPVYIWNTDSVMDVYLTMEIYPQMTLFIYLYMKKKDRLEKK